MDRLKELPSALVWDIFQELSSIPRASGNEAAVASWIASYASSHGCASRIDETGNVLVIAKSSEGCQNVPPLAFQAHMDMVAVRDETCRHDFSSDPLDLSIQEIDGEPFVTADGTTLGADDGIGIALALAIMTDDEIRHGPLEALFTVGEETSMAGISGFPGGMLGSKMMINIDSEADDTVTAGAAGGSDAEFSCVLECAGELKPSALKIEISGLTGGHSGIEIHCGRANAIVTLARAARRLMEKIPLELTSFDGGTFRNAIPTSAAMVLAGRDEDIRSAAAALSSIAGELASEFRETDPGIDHRWEQVKPSPSADHEQSRRIVGAFASLPDGVFSMNDEFPDTVQSSSNLGLVRTESGRIVATALMRSLVTTDPIKEIMKTHAGEYGLDLNFSGDYPCWKPSSYSPLLKIYEKVYAENCFAKPRVAVLHAGVECGILKGKYPDMDIISIGPNIIGAHTTGERVSVPSVEKIYGLLLEVLEELMDGAA